MVKAKHSRSTRFRLLTIAVCAGIAAVGVSIALFSSSAGPGAQNTGASSGAADRGVSGQPSAAAARHGTTSSHVSGSTTAKSVWHHLARERRIRRWQAGPGGTALAAVETQMGTAMQAAGMKLYAAMR